ncbi:MAG: hypothetical protein L6V93_04660 [Clostridiales bacterium]|nr:MAG: hypothetical protein L6V93_04660 [Clostridiales bacterium]
MFDADGNDITPNIPVYTFSTIYDDDTKLYAEFSAPYVNNSDSAIAYFGAPAQKFGRYEICNAHRLKPRQLIRTYTV